MAMSRSFGETSFTIRSPMRISPLVDSSNPAIIRSAVVLPQPDGPTRTINSLSRISRLMLLTAVTLSNDFVRSLNITPAIMRHCPLYAAHYNACCGSCQASPLSQSPDARGGREVQSEDQVEGRAHKSGGELAQHQPQEEGQGTTVGAQPAVAQQQHLDEPTDEDRQPEAKQPKAAGDQIACRVERPPEELRAHPCQKEGKEDAEHIGAHCTAVRLLGRGEPAVQD